MATVQVVFSDQKLEHQTDVISIDSNIGTKELSLILNHLLNSNKKYKFTIETKILTTNLDEFMESHSIETEDAIQIVYHEFFEDETPDYQHDNDTLISHAIQEGNKLYFSDYNGALKEIDVATKRMCTMYKHKLPIYMFAKNTDNTYIVDENNAIYDINGSLVYKSDDKIISISCNDCFMAFATIKNEICILRIETKELERVEDHGITDVNNVHCSNALQIASLKSGMYEAEYDNLDLCKNVCEFGISCSINHSENLFLGTYKGHILHISQKDGERRYNTEAQYIKHIAYNGSILAYSDQYNIFVLSQCCKFSTNKLSSEDEIAGLFWNDDKLTIFAGASIKTYKIEMNK